MHHPTGFSFGSSGGISFPPAAAAPAAAAPASTNGANPLPAGATPPTTTTTGDSIAPAGTSDVLTHYSFETLHQWISILNGHRKQLVSTSAVVEPLPTGIRREQIEKELEARLTVSTKNWHDYRNADGYNHLEELIFYQPRHWKDFVRTYVLEYNFDMANIYYGEYRAPTLRQRVKLGYGIVGFVLSHPDLAILQRYEALGLLLSLAAETKYAVVVQQSQFGSPGGAYVSTGQKEKYPEFQNPHSPFHYFDTLACGYDPKTLRRCSQECGVPRLALLKELTFSHRVVGQSLAKARIVQLLFGHFGHRHRMLSSTTSTTSSSSGETTTTATTAPPPSFGPLGPLFLSLIGSRATGKTALAREVAALVAHSEEEAVLFLQYHATSEDGRAAVTFQETKPAIREFVIRMLQRPKKHPVAVVVLDGYSNAADFRHDALDILLLEIQSAVKGTVASLDNIIFIQTVSLSMDGYLDSEMSQISSPEARAVTVIKEMLTTETVQRAMGWSDPDRTTHTIVPFVPLTRDERGVKAKLLISDDANAKGLSISVRHRFAEYIADAYDYCDEALTSTIMRQEIDYWRLLAGCDGGTS